jgi:hypothetical protein
MQDPVKFRAYADECMKLAQTASGKNRAALLRIAEAWIACAEEVERDQQRAGAEEGLGSAEPAIRDGGIKDTGKD